MVVKMTRGGMTHNINKGPMSQSGNTVITTTGLLPEPPGSLGLVGKVRWRQIGGILLGRKTWSNDWVPALEHICREYDHLAFIDNALKDPNCKMLVPSTNGRTLKTNPLLDLRLKIEAFIQSQLSYFGLTPMSAKGIFTQSEDMHEKKGPATRTHLNDDPFGEN